MKLSLTPIQYFTLDGKPLVSGRLKIHLHGSDTLANTYILSGTDFVPGPNPVILDNAGELQNSIFMDAAIYDVEVEQNVDGNYAKISDFQYGFNPPDVRNDTVVDGIAGLRDANPELGFVDVVGYDSDVHCGQRTFMWDPYCTAAEDGGTVFQSNGTENGRWILLSDLREMPCSYFGIKAGHEANLSSFLTYLETVGTYGIVMPPVPRFLAGDYVTEGTLSTTKVLSFDRGARLTKAFVLCPAIEVTPAQNYVGDFQFTRQQLAESCWFRRVSRFWACGAFELHQSRTNYFEDVDSGNYGSLCATLMHQKITGVPLGMTGSGLLEFNHCNIANYALSTAWHTSFKNCDFTDKFFNDGGWDFGTDTSHRQLVRSTENRLNVDNFADASAYVLQQAANGATTLDMLGRHIGLVSASMPFRSIRNAIIDELHANSGMALDNVSCPLVYFENKYQTVATKNCTLGIIQADVGTWNDNGSSLTFACNIDTTYTTVSWLKSAVDMGLHRIGRATDDLVYQKQVVLWGCTVNNGVIASSRPVVLECNIADTMLYVYPCETLVGNLNTWAMSMEIRKNRFNGAAGIAIGANNGLSDHLETVYECTLSNLAITDNVFNTSVSGITCPFWAGPGLAYRFMQGLAMYDGGNPFIRNMEYFPTVYEYRDNSGNCPRSYGVATTQVVESLYAQVYSWATSAEASATSTMDYPDNQVVLSVFALPAFGNPTREQVPSTTVQANTFRVHRLCVTVPFRGKALSTALSEEGQCLDYPRHGYLPMCACDRSQPNDMFYGIVGSCALSGGGVNPIGGGQ